MKKMILAVVAAVAVAGSAGAQSGVKYPYVTSENGGVVVVLRDSKGGIDESSLFSSRVTETKTGNEVSADNRMSRKFRVQKAQSQRSNVTWSDAVSYCDNLTEEGYSDWRLPSQRELLMIWLLGGVTNVTSGDKNDTGEGIATKPFSESYLYLQTDFEAFVTSDPYWAANKAGAIAGEAWNMHFERPLMYKSAITYGGKSRCVRDEW